MIKIIMKFTQITAAQVFKEKIVYPSKISCIS